VLLPPLLASPLLCLNKRTSSQLLLLKALLLLGFSPRCLSPLFTMSAPADVAAAAAATAAAAGEDQVAPLAKASPAAAGASSSVSIQPFSGGRVVHGHKPSTAGMGSMDLSEESRDTVEVKDSDTWSTHTSNHTNRRQWH